VEEKGETVMVWSVIQSLGGDSKNDASGQGGKASPEKKPRKKGRKAD